MITVYKNAIHDTQKVDLKQLGLSFLTFNPESLDSEFAIESIQGADGERIRKNQFKGRRIQATLFYKKANNIDFQNGKSAVYKLFNGRQKLLIVDSRLEVEKVWEVVVEGNYTLDNEQTPFTKGFELTFFSESSYASASESTETVITSTEGVVFNAGDIYLDARQHNIEFTFYGESTNLRIVNESTNSQFQYFGDTTMEDKIYVTSTYSEKNGINIFKDTEKYGALEFDLGSNTIKMYGVTGDYSLIIKHLELYI